MLELPAELDEEDSDDPAELDEEDSELEDVDSELDDELDESEPLAALVLELPERLSVR